MSMIIMITGRGSQCEFRFWTVGRISTPGGAVSVRIYSRTRRAGVLVRHIYEGITHTMMDAKFLELGSANAEGNNLNHKYAKRR